MRLIAVLVEYLKFATNSKFLNKQFTSEELKIVSEYDYNLKFKILNLNTSNYWLYYANFLLTNNYKFLAKTLELITYNHKSYHLHAGMIYYKRHQLYLALDKKALAKNDLEKAKNLEIDQIINL
ncbi:hypothetical protein [Rickettsiales endosymbiont of Stachyamoeba lipophora]|uniref:hypothetical protein n=1 Tax=Rickettsiales endosymbiont of Stachyamoeba lipophora TaxID=2486578 RepID=UPI000F6554D6|nr:hypothetical protein [Rickettsiales endosymbiont of Stachyamoeba lipophora]AZL16409.1 hypothetical protein EF513_07730 [Rickettsiales endosymbiont of Stachyamoeba lipophora]